MMTEDEFARLELEAEFPGWHVWIVHRYIGGPQWCARRHTDTLASVHAGSAGEMRQYLTEADGGA